MGIERPEFNLRGIEKIVKDYGSIALGLLLYLKTPIDVAKRAENGSEKWGCSLLWVQKVERKPQ